MRVTSVMSRFNVMYDKRSDLIVIDADVPGHVLRSLPGLRRDMVNQVTTCYPEPMVLDVARECSLSVARPAREAIESRARKVHESAAVDTTAEVALDDVLRPYQRAGVAYATLHPHSINADDMGLGKTLQAIAAAETAGRFPVLITCPASLRGNWMREIKRWSGRTAAVSDGRTIPDTDYVIMSYEACTKYAEELCNGAA